MSDILNEKTTLPKPTIKYMRNIRNYYNKWKSRTHSATSLRFALIDDHVARSKRSRKTERKIFEAIKAVKVKDDEARSLVKLVLRESRMTNFDPLLITAIIMAESTFNTRSHSENGKVGLMQIPVFWGPALASLSGIKWRGAEALENPEYNLKLGLWYLSHLRSRYNGNLEQTVLAYSMLSHERREEVLNRRQPAPKRKVVYLKNILRYYAKWGKNNYRPFALTFASAPTEKKSYQF